ncbi:uncharacterized protein LOC117136490 isoform X3 [Drosophila mauritiana]|uniref:Uncharacterized protein LOC117136490 isoform X3 n=1 Tax=Drosophila mauritiana TaxID=7226 RepID=A0A6P8JR60_DROMA|nr:uncharacterized protein LOC117136490 isoform X3 [Drosophila mauritiana]
MVRVLCAESRDIRLCFRQETSSRWQIIPIQMQRVAQELLTHTVRDLKRFALLSEPFKVGPCDKWVTTTLNSVLDYRSCDIRAHGWDFNVWAALMGSPHATQGQINPQNIRYAGRSTGLVQG